MVFFLGFIYIVKLCVSIFFVYAGFKLLYTKFKTEGLKSMTEDFFIMFVVVGLIYMLSARIAETRMHRRIQRKIIKQDRLHGSRIPLVRGADL